MFILVDQCRDALVVSFVYVAPPAKQTDSESFLVIVQASFAVSLFFPSSPFPPVAIGVDGRRKAADDGHDGPCEFKARPWWFVVAVLGLE
jgi:hypothetical protein